MSTNAQSIFSYTTSNGFSIRNFVDVDTIKHTDLVYMGKVFGISFPPHLVDEIHNIPVLRPPS